MNALKLQRFFEQHRARGEPLVLVSVTDTSGSTYSKAGDQMLINRNGVGCGMLSGGCLESDLAVRAQVVFESGEAQTVTYELAAGDEDIWGLGIGCDGSMQISLQLVTADSSYVPLQIPAPTSVLVLGAGLDAVPLARLCNELGWQCTLVDHRPAYLENTDFPAGCATVCLPPEDLAANLALADFDAAIIMSHHLASDREYLRQLAASPLTYIGLLGPAARRERLLADLGAEAEGLDDRLYGPAGMELGGRGPEVIALSITAQVQSILGRG